MKKSLITVLLVMAYVSQSLAREPVVGFEHWESTFPKGRFVRTSTAFALRGKFIPGKDYDTGVFKRFIQRCATKAFLDAGAVCFSSRGVLMAKSLWAVKDPVSPRLAWLATYETSDGFTLSMTAEMKDNWLTDWMDIIYRVDPVLNDAQSQRDADAGWLNYRRWTGWSHFSTWVSKNLPFGELYQEEKARVKALRDKQQEVLEKAGFGGKIVSDGESQSIPIHLDDPRVVQNLIASGFVSQEQMERIKDGKTLIRSFSDEFSNRALALSTPAPRDSSDENLVAELMTQLYFEDIDRLAEEKVRHLDYTPSEAKQWAANVRARRDRAGRNKNILSEAYANCRDGNLEEFYMRIGLGGGFWLSQEDYDDKAQKAFADVVFHMDPYLPVWGVAEEGENPRACLPMERRVNETWKLEGQVLNSLLPRDMEHYHFEDFVWVRRVKDIRTTDRDLSASLRAIIERSPLLKGKARDLCVLEMCKSYMGEDSSLRISPNDSTNPNLFMFEFDISKPSYILVDVESKLPVYVDLHMAADIIGRDRILDMERTKGLALEEGSTVEVTFESVVMEYGHVETPIPYNIEPPGRGAL